MGDAEYFAWLRDRLIHVYGENANADFVQRLDGVIERINTATAAGNLKATVGALDDLARQCAEQTTTPPLLYPSA